MDILGIAQEINSELRQIRSQYPTVLGAEERSDIFDSIETFLINEFADVIELSVCDLRNNQELLKWTYDLSDKNYPKRIGTDTSTILTLLNKIQPYAYINCRVTKWSFQFLELDQTLQERTLRNTIWDKSYRVPPNPDKNLISTKAQGNKSLRQSLNNSNNNYLEWDVIEYELLKIGSEINIFDNNLEKQIYTDLRNYFAKNYIEGLRLYLIAEPENTIITQWEFKLESNNCLVRDGESIQEIIAKAQMNKNSCYLQIKLEFTEQFELKFLQGTTFEQSSNGALIIKKKGGA